MRARVSVGTFTMIAIRGQVLGSLCMTVTCNPSTTNPVSVYIS